MQLGNYLRGTPVTPLAVPAFWSGTTKLDLELEAQSVSGAWLLIPVPEGPKMGSGRPHTFTALCCPSTPAEQVAY